MKNERNSELNRAAEAKVDSFVAEINRSRREALFLEEIPNSCVLSESEVSGMYHWRIVRSVDSDWLPLFENSLPFPLPLSFHTLIERYTFPSFEAGPIRMYSVGIRESQDDYMELQKAALRDKNLVPMLFKNGYLPFARPENDNYDQICFDYRREGKKKEPAVVTIDHEEILCNSRIKVVEVIAASFDGLLDRIIEDLHRKRQEGESHR
jgi:hypothetical protein